MLWILLAAVAQFIYAVVAVLDKYIVSDEKILPRPFVYAFYTCLVTGAWILVYFIGLIPGLGNLALPTFSNVLSPSLTVVALSLLAAYTIFIALVSLYDALKKADASDIVPIIGATAAIFSFGLSWLFLDTNLKPTFIWGIGLLALGTFFVSRLEFSRNTSLQVVHSGIFFALHLIAMKGLFEETDFDNGFFWSRVVLVLFALSLLLVPSYYEKIISQTKNTGKKAGLIIIFNKILAGVAAFMVFKAIDLGEVAVVQALDGLKFVFILIISIFFGSKIPHSAGENSNLPQDIFRKILFTTIIVAGFVVLFY